MEDPETSWAEGVILEVVETLAEVSSIYMSGESSMVLMREGQVLLSLVSTRYNPAGAELIKWCITIL